MQDTILRTMAALAISLACHALAAQALTGRVTADGPAGAPLEGATVAVLPSGPGALTDGSGRYRLDLPGAGGYTVVASYVGRVPDTARVKVAAGGGAHDVALRPAPGAVVAEVLDRRAPLRMGGASLSAAQVRALPALLGEADVLRSLQSLPGVQGGVEGQTALYVRGGGGDQSLVLMDGVPVYNTGHLFGFVSVFNTDAVAGAELTMGGFPARYGGRLSAIVDVRMREGTAGKRGGSLSVGPIAAKGHVEGPLFGGRTTYLAAFRRSLLDLWPGLRMTGEGGTALRFGDLNLKLSHRLGRHDSLSLTLYAGQDRYDRASARAGLGLRAEARERLWWANTVGGLRHVRRWGGRLSQETLASYSRYVYGTEDYRSVTRGDSLQASSLRYGASVAELGLRTDFSLATGGWASFRYGAGATARTFRTGRFELYSSGGGGLPPRDTSFGRPAAALPEGFAYAEALLSPGRGFSCNAGLHFSSMMGRYGRLQPRLAARQQLARGLALRAGFSAMRQYLHLLVSGSLGLPRDLWVPATASAPPQDSWQAGAGLDGTAGSGWSWSAEGYYKAMRSVVSYRPGSGVTSPGPIDGLLLVGSGEAYGAELSLRRTAGRLTGWAAYSLAWSWRTFPGINRGEPFPFRYDRRHDLSVAAVLAIVPGRLELSAAFALGSGNPVTLADNFVFATSLLHDLHVTPRAMLSPSSTNNYRVPSSHRLDLGLCFRAGGGRRWGHEVSLGVYNVYARRNPYYVNVRLDEQAGRYELYQLSLFGAVPSASYTLKW